MIKQRTELLSPAGNFDCGIAAFSYGADAIYLGLKNFSARADAMNFSHEELKKITSIAHSLGKSVYVAINTVIQNHEIPELIEKLGSVDEAEVDGIILQDFSLIPLIKKYFPKLKMHASTQMAVHNLEGAKILADIGFSRVVLARELNFQEIENITKNCGIETEVFIHGALCYSYSGLCFYSSFDRGESANRGKCTYPCRKIYGGTHPYAMKDLALNEYILKLRDIGVASLKIEGRKKTPLYVAATADYYRKILDGKSTKGCLDNIKRIFARPYTMLHFNGKNKDVIDRDFSGPRGLLIGKIERIKRNVITFKTSSHIEKHDGIAIEINGIERPFGFAIDKMWVHEKPSFIAEKGDKVELTVPDDTPDLEIGANIYCTSSQIAKSSYPFKETVLLKNIKKENLDIIFNMTQDKIEVIAGNISVTYNASFQKANNPEKMKDGVFTAFSKLGDSSFSLGHLEYNNDGFFAPISLLNEIRRQLCEKLETKPVYVLPTVEYPKYLPKNHQTNFVIKIDNIDYISEFTDKDFEKLSEIIVDIDSDFSKIQTPALISKIRVSVPVINRNNVMPNIKSKIKRLLENGFTKFSISNISGIYLMKEFGITDWICDYYLYTLNDFSAEFLLSCGAKRITLSPEDSSENMKTILENFADKTDVLVYGDIPLFISDNCLGDCKNCKSTDNVIVKNCRHYVFDKVPYCIANKVDNFAPLNFRLDFCFKKYSAQDVKNIFHNIMSKQCPRNSTSANFEKGFK